MAHRGDQWVGYDDVSDIRRKVTKYCINTFKVELITKRPQYNKIECHIERIIVESNYYIHDIYMIAFILYILVETIVS